MGFKLSTWEVKQFLIDTLALEDLSPGEIADDTPLFHNGLELDSIDVLELAMAMKKRYDISFGPEISLRTHFDTVESMTDFIRNSARINP